jgi:S-adenosylmethionine-diacylglycerol 3-amino-3-carboxypropyl transferase
MLAPRQAPASLQDKIYSHPELSKRLFAQDKAFFYSAFVVEEIR